MKAFFVLAAITLAQSAEEKAKAYIESNQVTERHEVLANMVGEWTAVQKVFIPDRPPAESEASATGVSRYGGRFVFLEFEGRSMGRRVEVLTIFGYDVYKEEYIAVALGESGTTMYTSAGEYDASTKTLDLRGEMHDAFGKHPVRYTFRFEGDDELVFDAYDTDEGQERRVVEITYRRRETAP